VVAVLLVAVYLARVDCLAAAVYLARVGCLVAAVYLAQVGYLVAVSKKSLFEKSRASLKRLIDLP
jgi:hypothetical protein